MPETLTQQHEMRELSHDPQVVLPEVLALQSLVDSLLAEGDKRVFAVLSKYLDQAA